MITHRCRVGGRRRKKAAPKTFLYIGYHPPSPPALKMTTVAVVSERAGYPQGVLAYVFKDDVHRTNHSEYPPGQAQ